MAANYLWLTDITEHWTDEATLYLCAVKDVWSNRIVGYSIDSRMKSRLAVAAIDNAVARRRADGQTTDGCIRTATEALNSAAGTASAPLDWGPNWLLVQAL